MVLTLSIFSLFWLIANYRRLGATDDKSVAYQMKINERIGSSKLTPSIRDLRKLYLIGIGALFFVILVFGLKALAHFLRA